MLPCLPSNLGGLVNQCHISILFSILFSQIFSNLVRKNIENFVEYVEGEPLMVKNMIGAYGNTDIALHGGAMLRECIRYENLARMTLYDETLWLFFDQVKMCTRRKGKREFQ